MPYATTKKKIKNLADQVDCSFFQPKRVLAKYGYSQNRLANELGISPGSLSGIVNGNPSIAQVKVMADAIGCSFFEFFQFADNAEHTAPLNANQVTCPACGAVLGLCQQ